MLDYVFALFFMGFPGVQILVLVSSIFLAINRNKLHKRVYGLFFPIIITMCNTWLISIDRTELFDDALRFSFFSLALIISDLAVLCTLFFTSSAISSILKSFSIISRFSEFFSSLIFPFIVNYW